MGQIGMDVERPDAVPYCNWDAPVTNATVRQALASGTEVDMVFWIAKITREARYDDVWKYVSLRRDIPPRWSQIEPQLGRWQGAAPLHRFNFQLAGAQDQIGQECRGQLE